MVTFDRIYEDRYRDDGTCFTQLRDGNWQIIFRTTTDLDYCRETKPGSWTSERVEQWAKAKITEYNLGSARIERW